MDPIWTFRHSVVCRAPTDFAWSFWTDVRNWALDADVITIDLHGPFAAGTTGVTMSKSTGRIEWRVAEAQPGRAILEFPAPGALATFAWSFEPLGESTRIIQRASLAGEQAPYYVQSIVPSLERGIPAGMWKLSDAIDAAFETRSPK